MGVGRSMAAFVGVRRSIVSSSYQSVSTPRGALAPRVERSHSGPAMNQLQNAWKPLILITAVACSSAPPSNVGRRPAAPTITFNAEGELTPPTGYRRWVFVGTPLTPNSLNDGHAAFPEFHNVYMDPTSFDAYATSGEFPEGTVIIKELVLVGAEQAVSGRGFFQGQYRGLEAAVKSAEYFPSEPGNWGYFSWTNPEGGPIRPSATAFPTESCNSCHSANAQDDFVFTQYYPVLRELHHPLGPATIAAEEPPSEWAATAETPASVAGAPPLGDQALFAFLRDRSYSDWVAREATSHRGGGPHTAVGLPVRVFMNPILAASLAAGSAEHPVGATVVKEMFSASNEPAGWAVMVKTRRASDEGRGWFWYEATSATDGTAMAARGNGVTGCLGCHARGADFVLSPLPR